MLSNLHTHTTFCDGQDTPEDIVRYAIKQGFDSIGFSGHCTTPYDLRYCMQDTPGYIAEIKRLQEQYKNDISVYLGVEEDAYAPVNRAEFQYIIGSFHYVKVNGKHYAIDSNMEYFNSALQACDNDPIRLAELYYSQFCEYIHSRKQDIIGHFDLLTKREETNTDLFFNDKQYWAIAEQHTKIALQADCIFEVNSGAVARGLRTSPYPHERLLRIICKNGGKVLLSSDSHSKETLDFHFAESKALLKDIGFDGVYYFVHDHFEKMPL